MDHPNEYRKYRKAFDYGIIKKNNETDFSTDAKVLYGLFLDRMSLSRINDWCDNDGNVYIIFTREEMNEILRTSNATISKIQKELKEKGLIERKKQGLGNPSLIYLKQFNVKRFKN